MPDIFDQLQADQAAAETPWQKFKRTFQAGGLGQLGHAVLDFAEAPSNPAAAVRAGKFGYDMLSAMAHEPGRVADEVRAAGAAYRKGDMREMETHLRQAVPLIGPQASLALGQIERGEYAEGLANTLDLIGQFAGPEIASEFGPRVLAGTARAGKAAIEHPVGQALAAGIRTGGPDVAKGAARVGAGLALGTHGPLPGLADALLGVEIGKPGLRQIASGTTAGWDALQKAYADATEARARSIAPPPERPAPAWTGQPEPQPSPQPPVEPIPGQLPSGRTVGGIQNQQPLAAPVENSAPVEFSTTPEPAPAGPEADPAFQKFLNDMSLGDLGGGVPFETLAKKYPQRAAKLQQIALDQWAKQGSEVAAPASAPRPAASAPLPEYEGSIPPGTTVADLIRQEREAAAKARATEATEPAKNLEISPPVETPAETPTGPDDSIARADVSGPPAEPLAGPDPEAAARKQAAAQAKIATSRARAADNIAAGLRENGETLASIDARTPEEQAAFWANAGGAHRAGYQPSPDTIALVRERLAAAEAQGAGTAAPPSPAPAGEPATPDAIVETARKLRAAGVDAATVAKYPPEMLQSIGVQPYQVKPLLRTLMGLERGGEAAPAAAPETTAAPAPEPAAAPAPVSPTDPASIASFLADKGMDHATASKLSPEQWQQAGVAPDQVQPVLDALAVKEGAASRPVSIRDIFSRPDEVAEAANQRIRKRGNLTSQHGGIPLDPRDVADMVVWGAAKVVKGVNDFGAWSADMVQQFGERIRPHLDQLWLEARKLHADAQQHMEISNRVPTAKKATEDPLAETLTTSLGTWMSEPERVEKNANALSKYPNFKDFKSRVAQKVIDNALDRMVKNLLYLHDKMPEAIRQRARLWYDGANKMAHDFAAEFGITPQQSAGVLASLSPQKDWFMNVDLGRRVMNAWKERESLSWQPEMEQTWQKKVGKSIKNPQLRQQVYNDIQGKSFNEITDPRQRAIWFRLHDEATAGRNYPTVTPEGEFADLFRKKGKKGKPGDPGNVAWGDYNVISKALSILEDGSLENISRNLGTEHKVRNFYNNIINPNSAEGHVTIDTHAVAAALLRALSGSSKEVAQNFGGKGAASSSITGESGMYGLYAEAYRRAAAQRGLLPREMQSITWEAVRGLFTPELKRSPLATDVTNIWRDVSNGKMTRAQALRKIWKTADGINDPAWYRPDSGASQALQGRGQP